MGYHLTVYIANHDTLNKSNLTVQDQSLEDTKHCSWESGPNEIAYSNSYHPAFEVEASGGHDLTGYVTYNLPPTNVPMKINFNTQGGNNGLFSLYVEIVNNEIDEKTGDVYPGYDQYFVVYTKHELVNDSNDEWNIYLDVYPGNYSGSIEHPGAIYGAHTRIQIDNQTGQWLILKELDNLPPADGEPLTYYTTSIPSGQKQYVLYSPNNIQTKLTYNLSDLYTVSITDDGVEEPIIDWSSDNMPYTANVKPLTASNGDQQYCITIMSTK